MFIKLTRWSADGKHVYVNTDRIVRFESSGNTPPATRLVMLDEKNSIDMTESPDEVHELTA